MTDSETPGLRPWTPAGETVRLRTPVFEVVERRCVSPKDGREKTFSCLNAPQWVMVLPVTADRRVVLVRQYRHGSSEFSLELPGGVAEPGQTLEETAARELMEETGYSAPKYELLCSLRPNPALFGNRIHTFLAWPAEPTGTVRFDENEDLASHLCPLDDLPGLVLDGAVDHALVVAAIGFFAARNARSPLPLPPA
ncbi:MAG: NUDIX hydrolase [Deltaproteobacteria bacterium]|nr:NUDIX hydrolase [Deltaproteobacteria bacterium]